ncbi:tRNA (5-methylaminomethyl-2-thiouridylate)-methyltransferase [Candidatus Kinetoplastibacterium desouzaii TCC079E]|uniref:tRNA-specific 2-thiouridylase MnmA n=1 Tax=Candidatus Kinetoplastidibacterium desouzai TCC079E TaxID=1208919 RepID=M1M3U5_9PROT|nr:tRNA 2-thiouridine(34) synthase MnmA [Candidatus Kinetoplastibacterium desouzaii]AGF46915.1 tRNA (5-methylaminomethyl-2-thiouridylate)-methyltransferase [Candidatus Kinetoplastibacterium desouzaii TCC079E]
MIKKLSKELVVIGMSGGVDSSVAAWILKEEGYKVVGLFMQNWENDESSSCSIKNDLLDATSVADLIGIDFEYVNFSEDYKEKVFSIFLKEYSLGRTPNPDILCNSEIKFKAFLDHSLKIGAKKIATGHYARIKKNENKYQLLKAIDLNKDQSYFLYRLNQEQLSRSLFPIGNLHKKDVRALAKKIGLPNAYKKDSTGICFIGEKSFTTFLNKYIPFKRGPILTLDGKQIGEHNGISFYTIGQRKGLGIGGVKNLSVSDNAWYVVKKDLYNNIIYVSQGRDSSLLQSKLLEAEDIHWIEGCEPQKLDNYLFSAKSRYRQQDSSCTIKTNQNKLIVSFLENQWAITEGQSVVIYDNDVCLGGGIIC